MSREIEYVSPADLFTNWGDITRKQQRSLEDDQYKKQMYGKTYGD